MCFVFVAASPKPRTKSRPTTTTRSSSSLFVISVSVVYSQLYWDLFLAAAADALVLVGIVAFGIVLGSNFSWHDNEMGQRNGPKDGDTVMPLDIHQQPLPRKHYSYDCHTRSIRSWHQLCLRVQQPRLADFGVSSVVQDCNHNRTCCCWNLGFIVVPKLVRPPLFPPPSPPSSSSCVRYCKTTSSNLQSREGKKKKLNYHQHSCIVRTCTTFRQDSIRNKRRGQTRRVQNSTRTVLSATKHHRKRGHLLVVLSSKRSR